MSMSSTDVTPPLLEMNPIQRMVRQEVNPPRRLPVALPSQVVVAVEQREHDIPGVLAAGQKPDDDTDLDSLDPSSSSPTRSWLWPIVSISWLVILVGVGVIIWQVHRIIDKDTTVPAPSAPPVLPSPPTTNPTFNLPPSRTAVPMPTLAPTTPIPPTASEPRCFVNHVELRNAVDSFMLDMSETSDVARQYGWPISTWCTGDVTSFESLFDVQRNERLLTFNEDVGQWNTSSVTNMRRTFRGHEKETSLFNRSLSGWQTSKVTTMDSMFRYAGSFNQPIQNWDVSRVESFYLFAMWAGAFDQNLSNWRTESATDVRWMFTNAREFNGDVSNFDVSRITDMDRMFFGARKFAQDISGWNVSLVTNFDRMFAFAYSFNVDISSWQIHPDAYLSKMFDNALAYNHSLCEWGSNMGPSTPADDMFVGSGCLTTESPDLTIATPGPFCHVCN